MKENMRFSIEDDGDYSQKPHYNAVFAIFYFKKLLIFLQTGDII